MAKIRRCSSEMKHICLQVFRLVSTILCEEIKADSQVYASQLKLQNQNLRTDLRWEAKRTRKFTFKFMFVVDLVIVTWE